MSWTHQTHDKCFPGLGKTRDGHYQHKNLAELCQLDFSRHDAGSVFKSLSARLSPPAVLPVLQHGSAVRGTDHACGAEEDWPRPRLVSLTFFFTLNI